MNRATSCNYGDPQWSLNPRAPLDLAQLSGLVSPWLEGTSLAKTGSCLEPQPSHNLHTAGQEAASAATRLQGQQARKRHPLAPPPTSWRIRINTPEGKILSLHTMPGKYALSLIWGPDTVVLLEPSTHPQTTDQINRVEPTSKQTLSRAICDSFLCRPFSSYVTREIQTERHRLQESFFSNPKPLQYWDNYGFHSVDYFKLSVIWVFFRVNDQLFIIAFYLPTSIPK